MKKSIIASLLLLTCTAQAESKIDLRHRESGGVGYSLGYTSFDYFYNTKGDGTEFLLDLRGHIFNDAHIAGNGGVGFRCPVSWDEYMLGANAFYDFRQLNHLFASQAGAGVEFLSENVDLRINGYYPFGDRNRVETRKFENFAGNGVLIQRKLKSTLPSIDGEVGIPLPKHCYFALGTYYLFEQENKGVKVGNAWGGRFRADFDLGKYCSLGLAVTHDSIFHTRVQGIFSINITFGSRRNVEEKPQRGKKKAAAPVENEGRNLRTVPIMRNEIIPVQDKKKTKEVLLDADGDPIRFFFVDNSVALLGDGSFERPFASLKEAEARSGKGDVIYVFPGDKTPKYYDEGIVLKEDQKLVSSALPVAIGDIVIPAQTPQIAPRITNIHSDQPIVGNPGRNRLKDFILIPAIDYVFGNFYAASHQAAPAAPGGVPGVAVPAAAADAFEASLLQDGWEVVPVPPAPIPAGPAIGLPGAPLPGGAQVMTDYVPSPPNVVAPPGGLLSYFIPGYNASDRAN